MELTPDVLVNRLISRGHYLLALRICEYLRLSKNRVLVHWACARVASGDKNEVIYPAIVAKLSGAAGVSYAEIADAAVRCNRPELAVDVRSHTIAFSSLFGCC
jgi:hypothetical protein